MSFKESISSPRAATRFAAELGRLRKALERGHLEIDIPDWIRLLKRGNERQKSEAARNLGIFFSGKQGDKGMREQAVSGLRDLLDDHDSRVRQEVVRALGLMRDHASAEGVKRKVVDAAEGREQEEVAEDSVVALCFMGENGVKALGELGADNKIRGNEKLRAVVERALYNMHVEGLG